MGQRSTNTMLSSIRQSLPKAIMAENFTSDIEKLRYSADGIHLNPVQTPMKQGCTRL